MNTKNLEQCLDACMLKSYEFSLYNSVVINICKICILRFGNILQCLNQFKEIYIISVIMLNI